MAKISFTTIVSPEVDPIAPTSPGTGIAGPTGTDWSVFDEAATSGDIVRYQLNDTISYPGLPDGFIWTHMRIAYETPSGIQIEQVPFGTSPSLEHRVRCKPNTSNKLWLQFGAEEARVIKVVQGEVFSPGDIVTGASSGTTATVESIDGDYLTVTRPSGGAGLFFPLQTDDPPEDLLVGAVVVSQTNSKHGSLAKLNASVIYSEWSVAKTVPTTTGTPSVLLAYVSTTAPLRDEGIRIELRPRGFNTINPRLDLDFQSEILDASEQGNLTFVPATLNHPTNRHIGYSEHHTLSFRGTGNRTVRHTIRNYDGSESASLDTVFNVGDPLNESWAYVVDVDESGLFTEGTAGGAQETSWETAYLAARSAASSWIRVHGTVTAPSVDFAQKTVKNLRVEGVGSGATINTSNAFKLGEIEKAAVLNLIVDGGQNVDDPMDTNRPNGGIDAVNTEQTHLTRVNIRNCNISINASMNIRTDDVLLVNDCRIERPQNFGILMGSAPIYLISGLRCEASIDAPRGGPKDESVAPFVSDHGGTCRSSRQLGRLGVYQKSLFFTNATWGSSTTATRFGCQPNVRIFGDAARETSTFRMTYCTLQSAYLGIESTSANNGVRSQDVILDGVHRLASEDHATLHLFKCGGLIMRNCLQLFPKVPRNTSSSRLDNIITLNNSGSVGHGWPGNLDNQDKIWIYNNTFVVLTDEVDQAGRATPNRLNVVNFFYYTVGNNVYHMPNYVNNPDAVDGPFDTTAKWTPIYTGYIAWNFSTNTPLDHTLYGSPVPERYAQFGHIATDTALYTPLAGSAARDSATETGVPVAIRDLTGAFRHTVVAARPASTGPSRGAVEPTV